MRASKTKSSGKGLQAVVIQSNVLLSFARNHQLPASALLDLSVSNEILNSSARP
jgi:hypothetical protein